MDQRAKYHFLAIDGGGTGCRAAIFTPAGDTLAVASGGPANVFSDMQKALGNIIATARSAADQAGLTDHDFAACITHAGLAGILTEADSRKVATALPFTQVTVSDDRATSVAGALEDADGALFAIGTGTIVATQQAKHIRGFGGWGFQLSDQASGAWLGRKILQRTILAHDGVCAHSDLTQAVIARFGGTPVDMVQFARSATPKEYAEWARDVVEAASAGDPHAVDLMKTGAGYLMSCLKAAGFSQGQTLCLSGGVGPHYTPYLDQTAQAAIRPPAGTALDGALRLARRQISERSGPL